MQGEVEQNKEIAEIIERHFWVCTYPFFNTELFVNVDSSFPDIFIELDLYDHTGDRINNVKLKFQKDEVGIVPIDNLIESCKLESGIKQAHLRVTSSSGVTLMCRYTEKNLNIFDSLSNKLTRNQRDFYPISSEQPTYLAVLNPLDKPLNIEIDYISAEKKKSEDFTIEARGCKLVDLNKKFPPVYYALLKAKNDCFIQFLEYKGEVY